MEKIKVVQIGTGKMAKYTMRYVEEKNGVIIAAFDVNSEVIGKDIGNIMETEERKVTVSNFSHAKEILTVLRPDICIIETMSLLEDVKDALLLCASLGINAITTCEEAFYSWNSNPNLTKQIHDLAVANNCTIVGSGYQDVFWGQLISSLAGSTQTIKMIKGSSSYNVEDYGIALAKAHGAGLSLKEFEDQIASIDRMSSEERNHLITSGTYSPSYMWNTNGWLATKLGLTIISQTQKCIPTTCDHDIHSTTLNMDIKSGDATGMSAVVTSITKEGVIIESECIGKVYAKEDFDKNEWSIIGEPDTTIIVNRPQTVELTCAAIVNRIPDVINAIPGFIPTATIGELKFKQTLEK